MSEQDKDVEFELVRTDNADLVRKILTVPKLYDVITEDNSPPRDEFQPIMHPDVIYLLAVRDKKVLGVFVVHPLNRTVAVGHANFLPNQWGEREQNKQIGQAALQWVWDNTEYQKIVTTVPVIYKHVLAYTQRIGMKREGMMRKSHLKHGELHDQYYMGISREE